MVVTVRYLAADVAGVIDDVGDGGRRVRVLTQDGGTVEFALQRATAQFRARDCGPRLVLRG